MKRAPLYEQIYREISEGIDSGRYKPGDKLPSEKDLTEQYHVSRITSKKALEMLAEEGKIMRMVGKGSFVMGPSDIREKEERMVQQEKNSAPGVKRPPLIGVIMESFAASFGTTLLNSIERECHKQGYSMALRCSHGSVEDEARAIDDFRALGASGLIMMCSQDEIYSPKVLQMVVEKYPIVTIDRQLKGIPVSYVGTDNIAAARDLTKYLLDKGYRKICFVKPAAIKTSSLQERQYGFIMAMNQYGIIADEKEWITDLKNTLPKNHSMESLQRDLGRVSKYLEEHKDTEAFVAAEYGIARILQRCLKESGRKCPVVCFDRVDDAVEEYFFTHIRQDETTIGKRAVRALVDVIGGNDNVENILVPFQIVEGMEDY